MKRSGFRNILEVMQVFGIAQELAQEYLLMRAIPHENLLGTSSGEILKDGSVVIPEQFLSNHYNPIIDGNLVVQPAGFSLLIFTKAGWERWSDNLWEQKLCDNATSGSYLLLLAQMFDLATKVTINADGKIQLPKSVCENVQFGIEVTLIMTQQYIHIMDTNKFLDYSEKKGL